MYLVGFLYDTWELACEEQPERSGATCKFVYYWYSTVVWCSHVSSADGGHTGAH